MFRKTAVALATLAALGAAALTPTAASADACASQGEVKLAQPAPAKPAVPAQPTPPPAPEK